jgi:hypothetical protein
MTVLSYTVLETWYIEVFMKHTNGYHVIKSSINVTKRFIFQIHNSDVHWC